MGVLTMIAQLIVSLSILVILHELGHFLPAKFFKTKVEKFYLFFNPWFSLFKKKVGETEYGVGWLPLGGYVKIAGMIDESMDTEQMKQPAQPWEFRSKPAWQRLIIMLGGVTVNFILGFLLFGMVLFFYGEKYLPAENAQYGIAVDSLGHDMGLRDGDHIVQIDTVAFERFEPVTLKREILLHDASKMVVIRDEEVKEISIDPKFVRLLSGDYQRAQLFGVRMPFTVDHVQKNSGAASAGIQEGDRLIAVNGEETPFLHEFLRAMQKDTGSTVTVGYERNGTEQQTTVERDKKGLIGVRPASAEEYFAFEHDSYSLLQAVPAGFTKGLSLLDDQVKAFGQMFRGKMKFSESLGGFGTITQLFSRTWDWESFWKVTALLSLILAIMNLLPIPALDGGHVMFLIYEVITGRKPSDKFMEISTIVGFILVIALVLYVNGLDVFRWLSGKFG